MPDRSFVTLTGHITCYRQWAHVNIAKHAVFPYLRISLRIDLSAVFRGG